MGKAKKEKQLGQVANKKLVSDAKKANVAATSVASKESEAKSYVKEHGKAVKIFADRRAKAKQVAKQQAQKEREAKALKKEHKKAAKGFEAHKNKSKKQAKALRSLAL